MNAIEVKGLTKQYPNGFQALRGLDLTASQGEIFTLLGPNGAGKSTLIHILTTYLAPTSGHASVLGMDVGRQGAAVRKQIACAAQTPSVDLHLTLEENMRFQARLYGINTADTAKRMEALVKTFDLAPYLKCPGAACSGGIRRRMDVAVSMMSRPAVLFLDEPTVGMDIPSRLSMWDTVGRIREEFGTTVFLTTHYLEEAKSLSDTICIMGGGRSLLQGSPSRLRKCFPQEYLRIDFPDEPAALTCMARWDHTAAPDHPVRREASLFIRADDIRKTFLETNTWLIQNHLPFMGISIIQPSLEDIFIHVTSSGKTAASKEVSQ